MKNFVIPFIFIFSTQLIWSQKIITVLDSITKEPLPYTTVTYLGTSSGTYTNELGKCMIDKYKDSILFSHLGYQNKIVNLLDIDSIFMQPSITKLDEVIINKNTINKKIGLDKKKSNISWYATTKTEYLCLIELKPNYKNSTVTKVHIPIKKSKTPNRSTKSLKAIVRVNIYSSIDGLPYEKIFTSLPAKASLNSKDILEFEIENTIDMDNTFYIGVETIGYVDENSNLVETKTGFLKLKFTQKNNEDFNIKTYVKPVFIKNTTLISLENMMKQHSEKNKVYNLAIGLTLSSYD